MLKSYFFNTQEKAFGIDLGTTNSCIAVIGDGALPQVVTLKSGKKTMPSCVMWCGKDNFIVGEEAYKHSDRPNVAYSMKRLMGTQEVVTLRYGKETMDLTPVKFSSLVLQNLVEEASSLYKDIKNVVITVPAYFNNREIEDTLMAGKLAGLNVLQIMREPTAAALLYDTADTTTSRILVYDLGGGTFDISLVDIVSKDTSILEEANNVYSTSFDTNSTKASKIFDVRKNSGDMRLGGDDIDKLLCNIILAQITQLGYDVNKIPKETLEWLRLQAESFKKLGDFLSVELELNYKEIGTGKHIIQKVIVTDEDLKKAIMHIYKKTRVITKEILKGENISSLTSITLVGGSTKSPILKKALASDFPAIHISDSLNPDEAVALGAAIQAHRLLHGDTSLSIQDVIPLAIGVKVSEKMKHIIKKNTKIPFSVIEEFTTVVDNQKAISVEVYQGNSTLLEECIYLGTLEIEDIKPCKAGEPKIFVNLKSDSNGLLYCTVTIDNVTVTKELKNLLGATQEQKALPKNERRLLIWRRSVEAIKNTKEREEGLRLWENAKSGEKADLRALTAFLSKYAIEEADNASRKL